MRYLFIVVCLLFMVGCGQKAKEVPKAEVAPIVDTVKAVKDTTKPLEKITVVKPAVKAKEAAKPVVNVQMDKSKVTIKVNK